MNGRGPGVATAASPKSSLSSPSSRSAAAAAAVAASPRSVRFAPQLHAPPSASVAAAASSASVLAASSSGAIAAAVDSDSQHIASSSLILARSGCSTVAALAALTALDLSNPPPAAAAAAAAAAPFASPDPPSHSSALDGDGDGGRDEDGLMALDELDSLFPDESGGGGDGGDDFERMFAASSVPVPLLSPAKRKEAQSLQLRVQQPETPPQLTSIPGSLWSLLPNLLFLNVSHNRLRALGAGFEAFNQLQSLDASWNELTTEGVEALADLRPECLQLRSLHLGHNRLERLPPCALAALAPSLQTLDVQHNWIARVEALQPLHGLVAMQQLWIAGNDVEHAFTAAPHADDPASPPPFVGSSLLSYCCFYLPWLHSFDGVAISESERSGAWSEFGNALTPAQLEAHVVAISTGMQALQQRASDEPAAPETAATTSAAAAAGFSMDDSLGLDEDPFKGLLLHPVLEEEDESRGASPRKQPPQSLSHSGSLVSPRSPRDQEIDLAQFAPASALASASASAPSPDATKTNGVVSDASTALSPALSSPEPPAASEHADHSFASSVQPPQPQQDRSHSARSSSVSAAFGSPPRASSASALDQSPPSAHHHRRAKTGGSSNTPKSSSASLHSSGRLSRSFFPAASAARGSSQHYTEREIEEMAAEVSRLRRKEEDQSTALATLRARFEASQEELGIKSRALDGAVADRAHAQQQMYELRRNIGFAQIDQSFQQWETRAGEETDGAAGGGLTDRSLRSLSPRTPRSIDNLRSSSNSLSSLPPLPKLSPPPPSTCDAPLSRALVEQYEEHVQALQQHAQESSLRAEQEQQSLSHLSRVSQATKQERALLARLALEAGHADEADEYDLADERAESPALLGSQPAFALALHAVQAKRAELEQTQGAWAHTKQQLDALTQDQFDTQAKLERLRTLSARPGDEISAQMHAADVSATLTHLDELVAEHSALSANLATQESQAGVAEVELSSLLCSLHKQFTLPSRRRTREAQAKLEAEEQRLALEMRSKAKTVAALDQRRAALNQESAAFERALLAHEKARLAEENATLQTSLRTKEQECAELQQRLAEALATIEATNDAAATPTPAAVDEGARVDSLVREAAARKSSVLLELQDQSLSRFEEEKKAWAHQLRTKHGEVLALQATVEELRTRAAQPPAAQAPSQHEIELEQQLRSQAALVAARTDALLAKQGEIDTMRSERAAMADRIQALQTQAEPKPGATSAAAAAEVVASKQLEIDTLRAERTQLLDQLQVARTAPMPDAALVSSKQTEIDSLQAERSKLLEQVRVLQCGSEAKQDLTALIAKQTEIDALKSERMQLLEQLHLRAAPAPAPSNAAADSAARVAALLIEVESLRSDRLQLLNQVQALTIASQPPAVAAPLRVAPTTSSDLLASAPRSAFASAPSSLPPSLPPSAAVTSRSAVVSPLLLPPDLPPPMLPESAAPSPTKLSPRGSSDVVRSHTGSPVDHPPTTPPPPASISHEESFLEQPPAFAGGPATFTFGAPLAPPAAVVVVQPALAAAAPVVALDPAVLFGAPVLPVAAEYPAHFPPKPELPRGGSSKSAGASAEVTPRRHTTNGSFTPAAAATPIALAQLLETVAAAAAAPKPAAQEHGLSELESLLSPPPLVQPQARPLPSRSQLPATTSAAASYAQFLHPPQTVSPAHQVEYLLPAAFAYQQPLPLPPSPQQPLQPHHAPTDGSAAEPLAFEHSQSTSPARGQQHNEEPMNHVQQLQQQQQQQQQQPRAPDPPQSSEAPAPSRPPLSPRALQEQILQLLTQQQHSMQAALMQQQAQQSAPIAQTSPQPVQPSQPSSTPSVPSPRISEESALTAAAEKLLAAVTAAASKAAAAQVQPPPANQPPALVPAPAATALALVQPPHPTPSPVVPHHSSSPVIPHPFDSPSPFSPLLHGGVGSAQNGGAGSSLVPASASPVLAASPYVTRAEKMLSLAVAQGHLPARGAQLSDDGETSARHASSSTTQAAGRSRSPTLAEALGYRKPSSSTAAAAAASSRSSAASPYAAASAASGLAPAVVEKVLHMQKITEQMQALQQQRNLIAADVGQHGETVAAAAPPKTKTARVSAIPVPAAAAKKAVVVAVAAPAPSASPSKPPRRPSSSPTRAAAKSVVDSHASSSARKPASGSSSSNGAVQTPRAPFGSAAAAAESKAILAARAHAAATSPTRHRGRAPATADSHSSYEHDEEPYAEPSRSHHAVPHHSPAPAAASSSLSPPRLSTPVLAVRSNLPLPDLRSLFAGVADDVPGEFSVFQPVQLSHNQAQVMAASRAQQAAIARQNAANMLLFNESSTPPLSMHSAVSSSSSANSAASSLPSSARSEPLPYFPPPQQHQQQQALYAAEQDHARAMSAFMSQAPSPSLSAIFAHAQSPQQQPMQPTHDYAQMPQQMQQQQPQMQRGMHAGVLVHSPPPRQRPTAAASSTSPPFSASASAHSMARDRRPAASSASPPRVQQSGSRGPADWSHLYSSGAVAPTSLAAFDTADLVAREAALQQMKREQTRMIRAAREEQAHR